MTLKRKILTLVTGLLLTTTVFAQTSSPVDTLTFCSTKFKVPIGCKAESQYQVSCDNYSMVWLYMNEQMLQYMPKKFIEQLEAKVKKFKKKTVSCYLLDTEAKGYVVSFKTDGETRHQIIAYGTVDGQPVLVQLSLNSEPKTNDDIPKFPRQIIRLKK